MKTTLLIKQHQKCLEILEGIERAEMRIKLHKEDLENFPIGCIINKVKINQAIRSRLINYYANTFTKMCQNVNV